MSTNHTRKPAVGELADEFLARYRRGERPSLTEYVQRFPEYADEIREVFPGMAMLEDFGPEMSALRGLPSESIADKKPEQLGDYRIIREVGRGGMGIVYEAEQLSLGRRVALKVLPQGLLLDKRHRQRFEREARAAARLHHTNIVPVFGVGEQEGLHYYVMQFIPGLGLDEVLIEVKRLRAAASGTAAPLDEPEPAVNNARSQLAGAVAGALVSGRFEVTRIAENGSDSTDQPTLIVDRPAESASEAAAAADKAPPTGSPVAPHSPNAALRHTTNGRLSETITGSAGFAFPGQSAADGRKNSRSIYWQSVARIGVQVAEALQYAHDQGIIHRDIKPGNLLLDPQGTVWVTDFGLAKATDQQNLTHTGDVLGTLRYMAPEQFDGKADHRSDQYALGMTLYELLALKPAFDETDRHKLIKQVTTGTPTRLRLLDASIPRDLETIVHKAIEREPAQRYQTAGELASDLQRFLGDEPILARQPTIIQFVTKWCRRHRGAVAAAFAVLVLAVVGLTIGSVLVSQERDAARDAAQRERVAAARERAAAEQADSERRVAVSERDTARYNLYVAHLHTAHADWKSGHTARMLETLAQHRLTPGQPDHRGWEWFYLASLARNDLATLDTGSPAVWQVLWSPDGRLIASRGSGLKVWDASSRQLVTSIPSAGLAAWSPDGSAIAAFAGGVLKVWDIPTGTERFALGSPSTEVYRLAWNPNGETLAVGHRSGDITLWDVKQDAKPITLRGTTGWVRSLAWSPDGRLLAAGGNHLGLLEIWSPADQKLVRSLNPHVHLIHGLAWSPDGSLLATGSADQHIRIWSAQTWECLVDIMGHAGPVDSLSFSPNGKLLLSGGTDSTVKVWDAETGRHQNTLRGHRAAVYSVAWAPDGARVASGGDDGCVKIWDPLQTADAREVGGREAAAFSPDGRWLITNSPEDQPGMVRLLDSHSGRIEREFRIHAEGICFDFAWSPDGRRVAAVNGRGVARVWDVGTNRETWAFEGDSPAFGELRAVDWNPDGRLFAIGGANDRLVGIWNVASGQRERALDGFRSPVASLCWSPNGRRLAAKDRYQEFRVWNAESWGIELEIKCHPTRPGPVIYGADGSHAVTWSPDGTLVAAGTSQGWILIWNMRTGREHLSIRAHSTSIRSIAWSPDGTRMASVSVDHTAKIWDLSTGAELLTLEGHGNMVHSARWSPDGRRLVTSGKSKTLIWDASKGYDHPP